MKSPKSQCINRKLKMHNWFNKKTVYGFLVVTAVTGVTFGIFLGLPRIFILFQIVSMAPFFIAAHFYFRSAEKLTPKIADRFSCPNCQKDNYVQAMVHTFWIRNTFSANWAIWECSGCKQPLKVRSASKVWGLSLLIVPIFFIVINLLNRFKLQMPPGSTFVILAVLWVGGGMGLITFFANKFASVEKVNDKTC